jgi:hypothetical protein
MRMRSLALGFTTVLVGIALSLSSCGDAKKNPKGGAGTAGAIGAAGASGEGGGGSEPVPDPVRCGREVCKALELPNFGAVAPCCADAEQGLCGLELNLLLPGMGCQAVTQSGALDKDCPNSKGGFTSGLLVPSFRGCCREGTNECGYYIDSVAGLLPFPLGCVDAAPFLQGAPVTSCDGSVAGGGGASSGGSGGAPSGGTSGAPSGGTSGAPSGGTGADPGGQGGASTAGEGGSSAGEAGGAAVPGGSAGEAGTSAGGGGNAAGEAGGGGASGAG